MEQRERRLVHPLDVINGDQQSPKRRQRAMTGLEETNGLDGAAVQGRLEEESSYPVAGASYVSKSSKKPASNGQWNRKLGLVSGKIDPLVELDPRTGFCQETALPTPRLAMDDRRNRPLSAHDRVGEVPERGELDVSPHEAPGHHHSLADHR